LDGQAASGTRVERGRLARGDDTLETGEFVDSYTFQGAPNQRVTIDLESSDFDGYLVLIPPKGEQLENDDAEDDADHSVIEADLDQSGTYRILVTSFEEGETGSYELRLNIDRAVRRVQVRPSAALLAYGQALNDRLERTDPLDDGGYVDTYRFDGRAGDQVVVEMSSADFDTYLTLVTPAGTEIENDDADGDQDLSRVALTLKESGRYTIQASSYDNKVTGAYRLTLRGAGGTGETRARGGPTPTVPPSTVPTPAVPTPTTASGGRILGVFVGISDYAGDNNDLEYTAEDARSIEGALVRGAGMRPDAGAVLVDRAATRAAVRDAVQRIGQQAGPDDLFVFFFSGHGNRVARTSAQASDPDGLDETIELYDGAIVDDEMNQMLSGIRARVLLVLDSCFSGGFSKDVISSPRRMGLFSSEEDVTSGVADKFRAGGYLVKFLAEAVGERQADKDRDGEITAIELSQYVHERYRSDVKSSEAASTSFSTSGPRTGYQHLVVDRGSIGPFDVLFRR
jgi:hypothetical protein